MRIENIAQNLILKEGIYYAQSQSEISYPETGNEICMQLEQDSFWFNHRNNVIFEVVAKYGNNGWFFDIGGGNGYISVGLQNMGRDVILVEPGTDGIVNAQKRNIKHIVCSTLEDAGFKDSCMSLVGLFDVVEHVEDDLGFLQKVYRCLKISGLAFITVPSYRVLWSEEDNKAGHYRRYTLKNLRDTLNQAGFSVIYSTYFFSILPIPIFLFRSFPSKLGIYCKPGQLNRQQKIHAHKNTALDSVLNIVWKLEINKIKKARKIHCGGSCLIVAEKQ